MYTVYLPHKTDFDINRRESENYSYNSGHCDKPELTVLAGKCWKQHIVWEETETFFMITRGATI